MKKFLLTVTLLVASALIVFAVPNKLKERQGKRDYMAAKIAYRANPTKGNYNRMMKARRDRATEVIKYHKERKAK